MKENIWSAEAKKNGEEKNGKYLETEIFFCRGEGKQRKKFSEKKNVMMADTETQRQTL